MKVDARARTMLAAQRFWAQLDPCERFDVGDALVLGTWDWRDWMDDQPPIGFLTELDRERILWEQTEVCS